MQKVNSEILDRLPPCNPQAESGLLGAMIIDPRQVDEVGAMVRPADFHEEQNGILFRHLLEMHGGRIGIDATTLCDRLSKAGDLERVGGAIRLWEIVAAGPLVIHIKQFAQIVREKAAYRRLIHTATISQSRI